ncbi:MAG: hypothetical protein KatS3mg100_075 [Candidatus Parcubacteria bacterium]|nr:MAG: hypothetical protein KatS3mg100_075 [Candidatus Parcubacteria bacterium]
MANTQGDVLALLMDSNERARVTRAFVLNPERAWSAAAMAEAVQVPAAVARQTLRALARAGFARAVRRRSSLLAVEYAPMNGFAFSAFQEFVLRVALPDLTQWARELARAGGRVRLVVASGILAGDPARPESEATPELLIVADKADPARLRRAVARLEREIGRELAVAIFSREEFAYRRNIHDRALREVFERPHRVVRGSLEGL